MEKELKDKCLRAYGTLTNCAILSENELFSKLLEVRLGMALGFLETVDAAEFENFFNEQDEAAYADSAYVGKKLPENVRNEVCEKGYRNKPLTDEQKENNRRKSKIRCRIEHVFAYMTMSMRGLSVRSIGIERAAFNIGLTNLLYNLCRYSFLSRKEAVTG